MSLTDDIYDVGVMAFFLLDGIEQEEEFDDTVSMAAISHAAFKKDNWAGVSEYCKELIHLMVVEE